ncbi:MULTISPECIES: sulfatase [unclassified Lentimonas]|uniref:sulfatase n=1 Tax=unclassified Lentimonas TaxID=2630993 RepID=UPI001321F7B4|nr:MULTISPECIES: sulfatase [unclassified Lentimonas]CAA6696508.1 Choline-sulfatase (EC [Lentimonas sp. CC19]CAA6696680.1 Choline-sulfatase (EC [Lentimonas sp. CC10]CAA7072439.1 Choline-sulfatase (EC [Lentimonas sp. CC11]
MSKHFISLLAALAVTVSLSATPPNVILITVDDLNDWIGPLAGNDPVKQQCQTPNIDTLCADGAIVFRNAVCAAPVCGPSRSSFLSGYMPNKTGVYGNSTNMRDATLVQNNPTLPEYFRLNGYYTLSTGKIFHGHETANGEDKGHWAFDTYFDNALYDTADPNKETVSKTNTFNGVTDDTPAYAEYAATKGLSWGPTLDSDITKTKDYQKADWAKSQLGSSGNGTLQEPFFMAVGLYKPHFPWFAPQTYFDQYAIHDSDYDPLNPLKDNIPTVETNGDLANLVTPTVLPTDLNDIDKPNGNNLFSSMKDYDWVVANDAEHNTIKEATRAYMACVSESDDALGVIMDALKNSDYLDNTIIVVTGDHGWHLGEKLRYHKSTLWAESVLTPLIISTPATRGAAIPQLEYCDNPVGLIDLYPTLIELCDLPVKPDLDGSSYANMLSNPSLDTDSVAVTVSTNGVSVLTRDWHYIEDRGKSDGMPASLLSKQLYDRNTDPNEHVNLLHSSNVTSAHTATAEALAIHAPQTFEPSVEQPSENGPNTLDTTIKPVRLSMDSDQDGYNDLMEQFLGTNGAIPAGSDPSNAIYPQISRKSNGMLAYHYGVSTAINSYTFTHTILVKDELSALTWSPFDTTVSTEFPSSYEYEFDPVDAQKFVKLSITATE